MSYLNLPSVNMANLSKGTISLWFRFSGDSMQKAIQHANNYPFLEDAPEILRGIMPLITFGRKTMAHCYGSEQKIVGMVPPGSPGGGVPIYATTPVDLGDQPCPPSHIGIDPSGPWLVMFFQTATRATVQGLAHETMSVEYVNVGSGTVPQYQIYTTVQDISYIRVGQPESFLINPKFEVTEDEWHHLLMSFDFSSNVDVIAWGHTESLPDGTTDEDIRDHTTSSYCRLWYAFDDENKNGRDNMGDNWVPRALNGITTETAALAQFDYFPHSDPFVTGGTENPEYHWSASPVPINGSPVGLPASAEYVDTVYHCEMAELQFFADLAIDTADISKRRAFVDADGKPVPPETTEELLGRRPDILLHKTSNWKAGLNTGSIGLDNTGHIILSGQFTPTGRIEKYKPDPSLEEETA